MVQLSMANIYELSTAYQQVQDAINQGEDETMIGILATIDDAIEQKADGYAKVIRNIESDIKGIKEEENRLKEKRNSLEKSIERMKKILQEAMIMTGKTKFKTNFFSFSIAANGGKVPVEFDEGLDFEILHDKYGSKYIATQFIPNKDEIREALENNIEIEGCHLGERGQSLRIR